MAGWIVKYNGPCSKCGTILHAGEVAVWNRATHTMSCVECPPPERLASSPDPLVAGTAGASAQREFERRLGKREAAAKAKWGERVGGWVTRFGAVPSSTTAWGIGARGEELLGEALAAVPDVVALHDRRVRGTRGNIDHLVIAPAGVFVVDAKSCRGVIEVRNHGGWFRSDLRLTVGRRDKSHLARNMKWQVDAILDVLAAETLDDQPAVLPILCFVDGRWPRFGAPEVFEGVLLESERSIVKVLSEPFIHSVDQIDQIARALAKAFPPKVSHAQAVER